ncbi:MAG: GNAT family N-acetyltransferase, partial [Oscillospiraceae bacterium]|nr:GNAT family N-acetyltransferase [Oscillospiraceae bacterium]
FLVISDSLRLRKYDGNYHLLLPGYQDPYVYQNSEGIFDEREIPDLSYVKGMCDWLAEHGELYFIEILEDGAYLPIGDVTVKQENPPITIWFGQYRSRGIGTRVMRAVIARCRELGYPKISNSSVYKWNTVSQKLHETLGFTKTGESETEYFYTLDLRRG